MSIDVGPTRPDVAKRRGEWIEPGAAEKPAWARQAVRWWYVFRYHRTRQLVGRAVKLARQRCFRFVERRDALRSPEVALRVRSGGDFESQAARRSAEWRGQESQRRARAVLEGRFEFLNIERELPDPIDWRLEQWPEAAHLWRFHLHYHEFLLDLAAAGLEEGDPAWFNRAWDLVARWIDGNPPDEDRGLVDAWHPYCISRRLPAWIGLWSASPVPEALSNRVLGSMLSQARYLERHLEWDLGGNHLMENLRALVLAGAFLDGPDADRWLSKGGRMLRKELAEQVLPHGEHFERSPMYHAAMLEAVLDVRDAVATVTPDLSRVCGETAQRMAEFVSKIVHPDGQIPLLGDSCFGETAPVDRLVARAARSVPQRAARPSPGTRRVGDYWIHRHEDDFLLFDAGPVGPDHLPAHAHADLLSLEASVGGHRLFVDAGVWGYEDDAMRRYCRSSRAHNVLQIDDRDQCDMWSRFRMGHRGRPFGFAAGEAGGFHWARASHNAYRDAGVPVVGRWIGCRPGGPWLCVDWAEGSGDHDVAVRLHLHPGVAVEKIADRELRLEVGGTELTLCFLTPGQIDVGESWYCPEFGRREPAPVVWWSRSGPLPAVCGWSLVWGQTAGRASIDTAGDDNVRLSWIEGDRCVRMQPAGRPLPNLDGS